MTICLVLNSRIGIKIPMMKNDVAEIKLLFFPENLCCADADNNTFFKQEPGQLKPLNIRGIVI